MALPARLGGLGLTNQITMTSEYSNSQHITVPLSALIVLQSNDLGTAREEQQDLKAAVKSKRHRHENVTAADLKENLPAPLKRVADHASEKVLPVGCRPYQLPIMASCFTRVHSGMLCA